MGAKRQKSNFQYVVCMERESRAPDTDEMDQSIRLLRGWETMGNCWRTEIWIEAERGGELA